MDWMVSYLKKNNSIKERKRSWGQVRIYQLISTANPALFVLDLSLIGCADPKRPPGYFSLFYILFFIHSFIYETIVHWVLTFFMHNKLSTGAVPSRYQQYVIDLNEHIPLKINHAKVEIMEEEIYILEDNISQQKLAKIKNRENREIEYRENKIDYIKCCSWEYIYENPCCCCSLPIIIFMLLCFKILILTILIYRTQ